MGHIFDPNISWGKYLELEALEDHRREISKQTQELIATEEQLSNRGVEIMQGVRGDIQGARDDIQEVSQAISFGFDKVVDQLEEINATFEWGFSEVLVALGKMQDSFDELIKIAKSQEQAWAYEQYRDAMYSFRRELYEEALVHITRAIEGYSGHTGYELEYRFHYLLGVVRIGSKKNFASNIIDSEEAEKAFLLAGRYAEYDYPKEAARAYVAAGWSAYVQGSMERALKHTQKAISLNALLGEAYFQQGKILCHLGKPDDALNNFIRKAIELEPLYSLKAGSDGDIKKYEKELNSLILDIKKENKKRAEDIRAKIGEAFSSVNKTKLYNHDNRKSVEKILKVPQAEIQSGDQQLHTDTFFGVLKANTFYVEAGNKLRSVSDDLENEIAKKINKQANEIDSKQKSYDLKRNRLPGTIEEKLVLIGSFFIALDIFSRMDVAKEIDPNNDLAVYVIVAAFWIIIIGIPTFYIFLIALAFVPFKERIIKMFLQKVPYEVKNLTREMNGVIKDKKQLGEMQRNINTNQLADSCFFTQRGIGTTSATGEVVDIMMGDVFQGKVVKIMTFGAFVEVLPGQEGLVHISELVSTRVERVEDVLKEGDVIAVKVKNIDDHGRINLTCVF